MDFRCWAVGLFEERLCLMAYLYLRPVVHYEFSLLDVVVGTGGRSIEISQKLFVAGWSVMLRRSPTAGATEQGESVGGVQR